MASNTQFGLILTKSDAPAEVVRPCANYHSSVWGDYFLKYTQLTELIEVCEVQVQLKEEVKKLLITIPDASIEKLELMDKIQRLGIAYHFENEIELSLKNILSTFDPNNLEDSDDLHSTSLRFRLLRQEGYYVSCDVFEKFKNHDGKFKDSMVGDIKGLLSLCEATHLSVQGEDILDEALTFSITHLESNMHNLDDFLKAQVEQTLNMPLRKSLTRLGARQYISIYQSENETKDDIVLKFAKMDFNTLQKLHQKELSDLTRWWTSLDVEKKLPFARNRLVECYFWAVGVFFEPQYSLARAICCKAIALISFHS